MKKLIGTNNISKIFLSQCVNNTISMCNKYKKSLMHKEFYAVFEICVPLYS